MILRRQCVIRLEGQNLLTDERRVRHRARIECTRIAYIVGLLAPFRQLHLYYVLVSPMEHDAHVSVFAEKEHAKHVRYTRNECREENDIAQLKFTKLKSYSNFHLLLSK